MKKLNRVLFSRYSISALIILLELLFMAHLVLSSWAYSLIALGVAYGIAIITLLFIINRDANPDNKVSWIAVVLAFPGFGTLLYLFFYRRRMTKKEEKLLVGLFDEINRHKRPSDSFSMLRRRSPLAAGKARAIMNDDTIADVYNASSSNFFSEGERFFEAMLRDLESAEKFIFLEYFYSCVLFGL